MALGTGEALRSNHATDADGRLLISTGGSAGSVLPARAGTAGVNPVSASVTSVQLLAANTSRLGARFFNDSSAVLYLKYGTTAATNSYTVQVGAGESFFVDTPVYSGRIDGIWSSATGTVYITELS